MVYQLFTGIRYDCLPSQHVVLSRKLYKVTFWEIDRKTGIFILSTFVITCYPDKPIVMAVNLSLFCYVVSLCL